MPRLQSKSRDIQKLSMNDFSGLLNLKDSPTMIADNELQVAENVEYDYEKRELKLVAGVSPVYTWTGAPVGFSFLFGTYFTERNAFVFIGSDNHAYVCDLVSVTDVGALNGSSDPCFALWDGKLLIASGGALQELTISGTTLANVTNSPNADLVFVRAGRVLVTKTGTDTLRYSAIGDNTSWTQNPNDPSSAYPLTIGYKDSGDIIAVKSLSSDLIVWKSDGRVYRVVGEPPTNQSVKEITDNTTCLGQRATAQAGNEVFFCGADGFRGLSTVVEYGDIRGVEFGDKVNPQLIKLLSNACKMYVIPHRRQVWVKAGNGNIVYIYHYLTKAFSVRKTEFNDLVMNGDDIYFLRGNKVLKLDPLTSKDDGVDIVGLIKTKKYIAGDHYLVKRMVVTTTNYIGGNAQLFIEKVFLPIDYSSLSPLILGNQSKLPGNTTPLSNKNIQRFVKRGNIRIKELDVTIKILTGSIGLSSVEFDISGVF